MLNCAEDLNINFSCETALSWCLVVLGVYRATQLAPSAFLASAAGSYNLINQILPAQWREGPHMQETYDQLLRGALTAGLVPGYWQQPLKSLGPGCMPSLSLP